MFRGRRVSCQVTMSLQRVSWPVCVPLATVVLQPHEQEVRGRGAKMSQDKGFGRTTRGGQAETAGSVQIQTPNEQVEWAHAYFWPASGTPARTLDLHTLPASPCSLRLRWADPKRLTE